MSWPLVRLEEICEISIGKTPSRSNASYWEGEEPWLSISDMKQGKTLIKTKEGITSKAIKECNMKIVVPGTVLFSFKLSIGKVGRASIPMYTNEAIASLPIKNEKLVDPIYLMYYLKEIAPKLTGDRAAMGATLNKQKLKEIKISLPPLDEQRRIAKTLDQFMSLKKLTIQKGEVFSELIHSTFDEYFGDPLMNPLGWEQVTLGELFEIKHGFAFKSINFLSKGRYVLLTPGNFNETGGYKDQGKKEKFLNDPVPKEFILKENDLLVAMTEQNPGLLGSPIIIPSGRLFLHNQRLGKLVPKQKYSPLYIFEVFNHPSIRKQIYMQSTGSKVKHTSPKKIADILIGFPPLELQENFCSIRQNIQMWETSKELVMEKIEQGQKSFNSQIFSAM